MLADGIVGGRLLRVPAVRRAQDAQRCGDELGGLIFFPLLFLTPNFVPRELLTRPMEIAATLNPVTYVDGGHAFADPVDLDWAVIGLGLRSSTAIFVVLMTGHQCEDDGEVRLGAAGGSSGSSPSLPVWASVRPAERTALE